LFSRHILRPGLGRACGAGQYCYGDGPNCLWSNLIKHLARFYRIKSPIEDRDKTEISMVTSELTSATYLYHYTSAKTLVEKILPSSNIRLGPFAETNDPRESKDWIFGFGTNTGWEGMSEELEKSLGKEATTTLKETTKILCLSKDDDRKAGYNTDQLHYWGFCQPRMWAQYGDKHSGVCLVFGRKELEDAIVTTLGGKGLLFSGDVVYRDWSYSQALRNRAFILNADLAREKGVKAAVQTHLQRHWKDIFLEKSEDWRDEHEYRWIFNDGEPGAAYVPISNSLKAIVLGSDFQQEQWGDPYHFKRDYNLKAAKLSWRNGIPQMLPPFGGPWI